MEVAKQLSNGTLIILMMRHKFIQPPTMDDPDTPGVHNRTRLNEIDTASRLGGGSQPQTGIRAIEGGVLRLAEEVRIGSFGGEIARKIAPLGSIDALTRWARSASPALLLP